MYHIYIYIYIILLKLVYNEFHVPDVIYMYILHPGHEIHSVNSPTAKSNHVDVLANEILLQNVFLRTRRYLVKI
jgi:hypothetical protein